MSKQSEARDTQGYRTEQRNCGNCSHRTHDLALPAWMERSNAERVKDGLPPYYSVVNAEERNHRCTIGDFAVKKTATCDRWTSGEPQEIHQ
jgi:hypothetical protein